MSIFVAQKRLLGAASRFANLEFVGSSNVTSFGSNVTHNHALDTLSGGIGNKPIPGDVVIVFSAMSRISGDWAYPVCSEAEDSRNLFGSSLVDCITSIGLVNITSPAITSINFPILTPGVSQGVSTRCAVFRKADSASIFSDYASDSTNTGRPPNVSFTNTVSGSAVLACWATTLAGVQVSSTNMDTAIPPAPQSFDVAFGLSQDVPSGSFTATISTGTGSSRAANTQLLSIPPLT